jgi:hypothetical protein
VHKPQNACLLFRLHSFGNGFDLEHMRRKVTVEMSVVALGSSRIATLRELLLILSTESAGTLRLRLQRCTRSVPQG